MLDTPSKSTVYALATKSGNRFRKNEVYRFEHHVNKLFRTVIDGASRYESYPFDNISAHLWNGLGVFQHVAGRFIELSTPDIFTFIEENPYACPKCGSRTDTVHIMDINSSVERCLNTKCNFTFIAESE